MNNSNKEVYCAFCEKKGMLREFKGIYICNDCIEDVKKGRYQKEEQET